MSATRAEHAHREPVLKLRRMAIVAAFASASAAVGVLHISDRGVARTAVPLPGAPASTPPAEKESSASLTDSVALVHSTSLIALSAAPPSRTANSNSPAPPNLAALHQLLRDHPETALALAQSAVARAPNGADAAEQTWIIVKALTNLGRFDDARAEAISMMNQYADSSWGRDVARHVLSNP